MILYGCFVLVQLSKANLRCQTGWDAGIPLCWSKQKLGQQDLKWRKKRIAFMFREEAKAVITTERILGNCCDALLY